jgi:hypothetical protein
MAVKNIAVFGSIPTNLQPRTQSIRSKMRVSETPTSRSSFLTTKGRKTLPTKNIQRLRKELSPAEARAR